MLRALIAEMRKLKRSMMPWWTAIVVVTAPFITATTVVMQDRGAERTSWVAFMRAGPQLAAGWYGAVLFGLVAAYLFGREYGEGTTKEMLTLPIRREHFFTAKMVVLAGWVLALTLLSVVVQAGYAAVLGIRGAEWADAARVLTLSIKVAVLIYATLPLVALLAMMGRGYLAPMAFSAVMTAMGLGLAEAGWARWFPWSMPLSATGMSLFPSVPMPSLVGGSWALMALVFVTGSAAAVWYLDRADTLP